VGEDGNEGGDVGRQGAVHEDRGEDVEDDEEEDESENKTEDERF
jgi:hypothetical protein